MSRGAEVRADTGHESLAPGSLLGETPRLYGRGVHLIAQVKLLPTERQAESLRRTIATLNAAANEVSIVAWRHRVFSRARLQRVCYYAIRARYGVGAQAAVHVTRKVSDAYRVDQWTVREFRADGAVPYDDRILSWKPDQGTVSIWTVDGRITVAFACGERSKKLLASRKGESDLVLRDGQFYLLATCVEEEPVPVWSGEVLGVDRGIVNIATCSDGANHTGKGVNRVRHRNEALRARLQRKQTKSAKRLLKRRARKESRFVRDTNHKISYRIVREAKGTGAAIVLEDLGGMRGRTTVRRSQRRAHNSWSYSQLGQFIEYKAKRQGLLTVKVDPHYTSQHCPVCGHISRRNRPRRDAFSCQICGLAGPSDLIASVNIASLGRAELGRGDVTRPDAGVQADRKPIGLGSPESEELIKPLRPEHLSAALLASSVL